MIRFLTVDEILELHRLVIRQSGGSQGVRDAGMIESAAAQPQMTFDGVDLYPDVVSKAAALGFALVCNHPFIDGNKRVGHAAMETFLVLNGWEIHESVDEQESLILRTAAGSTSLAAFTEWLKARVRER